MAFRPRREVPADHCRGHAVVVGRGEQRDRPPVGEPDHADPLGDPPAGCSARTSRQRGEVPDVLRQGVPPGHDGVDEVGVAGVVVLGIPVLALPEAAQVGRQHDVPLPDELEGVVAVRRVGVLQPDRLGLARAVPVAGQHRRALGDPPVGDQQVRRAPTWCPRCRRRSCPADSRRTATDSSVSRLSGTGSGIGPSSSTQARPPAVEPPRQRRQIPFGQGILVRRGGQPRHPLVPRRVVPSPGRQARDPVPHHSSAAPLRRLRTPSSTRPM